MSRPGPPPHKKYEEYAYVLDFIHHGESKVIRGREGPLVQSIGEARLTLLEILALAGVMFEVGERIYIGKAGRTKVISVLGRLRYEDLTPEARAELLPVVERIVRANEVRYVSYFNELQPVTPRLHALELIPGIGKTFMTTILRERERQPFTSFEDIEARVGLKDPAKLVAKRIVEELSGGSRITIFVKR